MIDINVIKGYYPTAVRNNSAFDKHILKEYLQLLILDFISASAYAPKVSFIGDTNLRLIHGIDRFSEDLDFDCKDMSEAEFMTMTDEVLAFLRTNDFNVEARDKANPKLTAFRRNIYFPGLLFELNLTGHKEERFLIKIEAQDQGVAYTPVLTDVKGCGFFFPLQTPPKSVLCAMKLSALLARGKGRDFYDAMFLLSQTEPDYEFLAARCGIKDKNNLKAKIKTLLSTTDLSRKAEDFKHLLFNMANSSKILRFGEFIESL
ncbi:MAG: nucleotidyl transferase AbiEii/AbiGii toxin family protein [Muribaculaceae bacterium]|nr:nucleotidyl transferase AbiEii/AbiGii toxin family protein [Muribaculaceae bacterium]